AERVAPLADEPAHIPTTPPLKRSSFATGAWPQSLLRRLLGLRPKRSAARDTLAGKYRSPEADARLRRDGAVRRAGLLALTVAQTWIATDFMTTVLPYQGRQPLEIAILVLFALLFGWVSAGFWTALAGFFLLLTGRDRYAISSRTAKDGPIDPSARTAVIMPICNEDVPRVFAGLRATYESLQRTGQLQHFDFFVLSDSADADKRAAEQAAWLSLCQAVNGFGRVFYRWRRIRIKRKSGN